MASRPMICTCRHLPSRTSAEGCHSQAGLSLVIYKPYRLSSIKGKHILASSAPMQTGAESSEWVPSKGIEPCFDHCKSNVSERWYPTLPG
jgi:hypothetical protein